MIAQLMFFPPSDFFYYNFFSFYIPDTFKHVDDAMKYSVMQMQ